MGVLLSCCRTPLALAHQELPAYQVSLISLFVLSLCTFIFHFIISSSSPHNDNPSRHTPNASLPPSASTSYTGPAITTISQHVPQVPFFHFLLGVLILFLWLGAIVTWSLTLGSISVILRNNALLYGVIAANGGPLYLLFFKQGINGRIDWSLVGLMGWVLWPLYLGMLLGTLGFGQGERVTEVGN